MVLNFLKTNSAPVAIDFGYTQIKILQLTPTDPATVLSAVCLSIPESIRQDREARTAFISENLPRVMREGRFKGKVAFCSIPTWQTFIQHFRIGKADQAARERMLKEKLQSIIAFDPEQIIMRHTEVCMVQSNKEAMTEVICFTVARDIVMEQVNILRKCKFEIGGLQAEPLALLHAFKHLYRRKNDDQITTLYLDMGGSTSKVMITHGSELRFARTIPIGGRHLDQAVADHLHCDAAAAHVYRLNEMSNQATLHQQAFARIDSSSRKAGALLAGTLSHNGASANESAPPDSIPTSDAQSGEPDFNGDPNTDHPRSERRHGSIPKEFAPVETDGIPIDSMNQVRAAMIDGESGSVDQSLVREPLNAQVDQIVEEIRMCGRYHANLFPDRTIERMVLIGGESHDVVLSRSLAENLNLTTYIGNPLKRTPVTGESTLIGIEDTTSPAGWGVVAGLCQCPLE